MRKDPIGKGSERVLVWTLLFILSAALAVGCGKKGPPRLPDLQAPESIDDLAALQEGDEIVLTWTSSAADQTAVVAVGYAIYRSAEPAGEEACPGCPVLFRRVAEVPATGEGDQRQSFVYREPFAPGTRYRFKVVPFDARGQLGSDSNVVRLGPD
jgi:predicted small lipoprotein YifL